MNVVREGRSRHARASGRIAWAALLALSVASCDQGPSRPDKTPPPPPPAATSIAGESAQGSAAPAASSPTAASAAPAAQAAEGGALVGTWEGRYVAKKGSVQMPPRVKDKGRAADDGKALTGPGQVEIEITKEGELRGKSTGALGPATLRGKLDVTGKMVGAQWYPDDVRAPDAMSGVLIGTLTNDGVIVADIRVAGPDAIMVREATAVELKRKP